MLKRIFRINIRYAIIILWQLVTYVELSGNQTNIFELECLRELPVGHLLKIRRALQLLSIEDNVHELSLDDDGDGGDGVHDEGFRIGEAHDAVIDDARNFNHSDGEVKALPLIGSHLKKMGWDPWHEERPTKIQKFFQLSVTALAFLAFGGYLLCMIVQAIKSKGTTYYYPSLQSTNRKRHPLRRERRETFDGLNRTEANRQAEPSPDDLYHVLVMAAEGYVRLNSS